MTPPRWTCADEELWTRYAVAALAGMLARGPSAAAEETAARAADVMLERHRARFPPPPKTGEFW